MTADGTSYLRYMRFTNAPTSIRNIKLHETKRVREEWISERAKMWYESDDPVTQPSESPRFPRLCELIFVSGSGLKSPQRQIDLISCFRDICNEQEGESVCNKEDCKWYGRRFSSYRALTLHANLKHKKATTKVIEQEIQDEIKEGRLKSLITFHWREFTQHNPGQTFIAVSSFDSTRGL